MDKGKAKQILIDIKNECAEHENCDTCPFYIGEELESLCIFDADVDITPGEWDGINAMPNLREVIK